MCSVSWPNCLCSVLSHLFIGSTLKRLCLGKERSSSNYLIYIFPTPLSSLLSPHYLGTLLCQLLFAFFLTIRMKNVAVVQSVKKKIYETVHRLLFVAFFFFAWQCQCRECRVQSLLAYQDISFATTILVRVLYLVTLWLFPNFLIYTEEF